MLAFATFSNHRSEPYFTFVKNGQMTIEARLRKGKYRLIKPGDHIVVNDEEETDSFEVSVKAVRNYKTFKELYTHEPLNKVMPDVKTVKEALKVIFSRFYTKDQEKKFGVVAIVVEKNLDLPRPLANREKSY